VCTGLHWYPGQSTYLDLELEAAKLFNQKISSPGVESHGKEDGQIDR
jgi:hypothetical protein